MDNWIDIEVCFRRMDPECVRTCIHTAYITCDCVCIVVWHQETPFESEHVYEHPHTKRTVFFVFYRSSSSELLSHVHNSIHVGEGEGHPRLNLNP